MTFEFDANEVDPNTQFDPVPPGWYTCRISSVELGKTNAGHQRLKFTFDVDHAASQFGGRKFFLNLNVGHPNQQAREISNRQLSGICRAVGVLKLNEHNLGELCDRLIDVRVVIRADDHYGDRNDVKQVREHMTRRPGNSAPARFSHDATPKPKQRVAPQGYGDPLPDIPF